MAKLLEIDELLRFLGYGNLGGRFWFIGMEERGADTDLDLELRWRLTFQPIDDLMEVHERWVRFKPNEPFDRRRLIPTWSVMSKLVLRLSGSPDWQDVASVRRCQAERLGRKGGDTFLTEILPLPAPNLASWPYGKYFATRADYENRVLPRRLEALRALFDQHRPEYVFCYGKAYWEHHRKLFFGANFHPAAGGQVEVGRLGATTVVLTRFFAPFLISNALVDEIGGLIGAR